MSSIQSASKRRVTARVIDLPSDMDVSPINLNESGDTDIIVQATPIKQTPIKIQHTQQSDIHNRSINYTTSDQHNTIQNNINQLDTCNINNTNADNTSIDEILQETRKLYEYEKSLLQPNKSILFGCAYSYEQLESYTDAYQIYNELYTQNYNTTTCLYHMCKCELYSGYIVNAKSILQLLLQHDPTNKNIKKLVLEYELIKNREGKSMLLILGAVMSCIGLYTMYRKQNHTPATINHKY